MQAALNTKQPRRGPLVGLKVLEFAGLGPAPLAGMLLADLGADVVRIDRPPAKSADSADVTSRGKRSVVLDLKTEPGYRTALALAKRADVLIEGFRPGVMERLGLGTEALLDINPKLVYGRITGWGQQGPLAHAAGHDLNYIALTGALAAIGPRDGKPIPPLNLVGDYGGGTMFLLFGVLSALYERERSGQGQVIDAAMTDGTLALLAPIVGLRAAGHWPASRGGNLLDGGAHFYNAYQCADGAYVSVAAVESHFYALLRDKLGISDVPEFDPQMDIEQWPALSDRLQQVFLTKTRAEWTALLEGTDACFAPVLDFDEAPRHPHNVARQSHMSLDGVLQPAPAPRFSRTQPSTPCPPCATEANTEGVLTDWSAA
ncbi:alpha-methylacyl-CoA racemase [Paraburkholderia sp. HC6.4b]|uniref:CaiB/BaiF CoA transferase family protein n=1 Tax=unclassified Paraburkholderia TaxID=2615204 RepID=UPI001804DAAF|nr:MULTISPECIES: CaiB/BaiF CoA-transferase family protein [unclassified Paraburkholderia]MBB5406313.1 alpha-methylacyl-CoA racemase [Paraburkholderia sp. HC6.4b]MBB5448711.1 alpha-methylacyl-CoA racemase [Paraburkholderia sp. Kb1A]